MSSTFLAICLLLSLQHKLKIQSPNKKSYSTTKKTYKNAIYLLYIYILLESLNSINIYKNL